MFFSRSEVGPVVIETWEESSKPTYGSQDDLLVRRQGDSLRVAVMDGCTPHRHTPTFGVLDGAAYASSLVRGALGTTAPVVEAIEGANRMLFDTAPDVLYRTRPTTAFTACDIELVDGLPVVDVAGAGDCEVWVRHGVEWTRLIGGSYWSEEAKAIWQSRIAGVTDLYEALDVEEEEGSKPGALTSPQIGSFTSSTIVSAEIGEWDEIVLASDGARLDAERVARLSERMNEIRTWEVAAAERGELSKVKPFDDITVARITQTRPQILGEFADKP